MLVIHTMGEESTYIKCLIGSSVREVINKANEIGITKSEIINIFPLKDQVYLVYELNTKN